MWELNESLLNISTQGGINYLQAKEYVTIESCRAAMAQTTFWMYLLGILFLLSWIAFCILLYKYRKVYKQQNP